MTLPESISLYDVEKALAQKRLVDFTTFTFPKYIVEWFHEKLAEKLDAFERGDITHLMVFMPPQHGKSELVSRRLPAKLFGSNPNLNMILGSYNDKFAKKFCRSIQRTIASDRYRELFPETKLDGQDVPAGTFVKTANEFEVHNGKDVTGSFMSVGVGTGATGNPCDVLVLDDVIKDRKEAESKTYRETVWDWWVDALSTRLHDRSKVLITLTRWHEDDIAGRILAEEGRVEDGGKWHVFVLPAIKEDDSNPDDIRKIGQPLYPSKHGLTKLNKIKDKNPRTWSSLYQQRPAPVEGGLVKRNYFPIWTPAQVLAFIRQRPYAKHFVADTAYTEKQKNDASGLLTFFILENLLFITDWKKFRAEFPDLIAELKKHMERHASRESMLFVEPKASGKSTVQTLKRMRYDNGRLINVAEDTPPDTDKSARASSITDILASGRVILVAGFWNEPFLQELAIFPNGKEDEAIDCLVMAVDKLENPRFLKTGTLKSSIPGA